MDTYEGGSGGRRQKPCRACNDFKSWMKIGPESSKGNASNSTETANESIQGLPPTDTRKGTEGGSKVGKKSFIYLKVMIS